MTSIAAYERTITRRVLEGFRDMGLPGFRLFGIGGPARAGERVPTFAFDIGGLTATETKRRLWTRAGIQIADGNHYSAAVVRHLGRPERSARRASRIMTVATAAFLEAWPGSKKIEETPES
jgi:selenocysteine lyase/cysteine desulfurase